MNMIEKLYKWTCRHQKFLVLMSIYLLLISSCYDVTGEARNDELEVSILDIGQGDAILLRQNKWYALVDAGPPKSGLLDTLRKRGVDSLAWVALTHRNLDHGGGFNEIIGEIPIGQFYTSSDTSHKEQWAQIQQKLEENKILSQVVARGDFLSGPNRIRVLWPQENSQNFDNAASLVLEVTHQYESALLTGDMGEEQEKELMLLDSKLNVDYLKVAHHGSKYSSSLSFLGMLSPKKAAISCGRNNDYGHPTSSTMTHLRQVIGDLNNIERTDLNGTITWIVR